MRSSGASARGRGILAAGAAIQLLTGLPAAWGVFQQPVMEEYALSEAGAAAAQRWDARRFSTRFDKKRAQKTTAFPRYYKAVAEITQHPLQEHASAFLKNPSLCYSIVSSFMIHSTPPAFL